jgi:hypothetical protein
MGTLRTTRESSGLDDLAVASSGGSKSDCRPLRFQRGREYDLVTTTERLGFGYSGMRTQCLSNLTTLERASMLECSGAGMPGSMSGLASSPESRDMKTTTAEKWHDPNIFITCLHHNNNTTEKAPGVSLDFCSGFLPSH